jgi:hypothetical protein
VSNRRTTQVTGRDAGDNVVSGVSALAQRFSIRHRLGRALAAAILAVATGVIAYACADGGYETSWDAEQSSAILSPANDTRSNLLLLLADRQGSATADPASMAKGIVPIEFPWQVLRARLSPPPENGEDRWSRYYQDEGGGSRCQSNEVGAAAFMAEVRAASSIAPEERQQLIAAREGLRPTCEAPDASPYRPVDFTSPAAKEFAAYLVGADEFYRGEFESARNRFIALNRASNPWLRETALYMLARNELNRAQAISLNEYGDLAPIAQRDRQAIGDAGIGFNAYIQAYPRGRYTASARGLLRRVAWLKGDRQALGAFYSDALGEAAARDGASADVRLIQEIDVKILPDGDDAGVTDPVLLAVVDLMRLRQRGNEESYPDDYRGPTLERAELERQRPIFKSEPALFDYLLAVEAFYGRKQPQEVLALIPDAAHQRSFTYLQFSRQMLRGFALEAVKDRNARNFWLSLFPGANRPYQREAVELALANHDGEAGQAERLFVSDSPVRHSLIRQHLLEDDAGPVLLRQQVRTGISEHERDVSLYLLLAGDLHHGLYADFLKDSAILGSRPQPKADQYYWNWSVGGYDPTYTEELGSPPLHVFAAGGSDDLSPCPDIRATATSLSANPAVIRPRLCLAEFFRRKGFDGWGEEYDGAKMVSRIRSGFPGKPLHRMQIYRSVIASGAASADDKTFALNRAIRCFAPSGYNSCGGSDIPVEQRKAWFAQLKRDHPQSNWAKDLKYYW